MKPYNKSTIPLAKKLRKDMTPWERHLWYDFLRYYPIRFQRQKAIGNFIVDFYCHEARLIIEESGCGISVEPGDYPAIEELIEKYIQLNGTKEIKRMGTNGRKYLVSHLTKDVSIKKYRDEILSC